VAGADWVSEDRGERLMPRRKLLHEWMHRLQMYDPRRVLRVWAAASYGYSERERQEQYDQIINALAANNGEDPIEALAVLSFVNAVEVVDADGNGRLVYVDWP
jgi:hypothetical protein